MHRLSLRFVSSDGRGEGYSLVFDSTSLLIELLLLLNLHLGRVRTVAKESRTQIFHTQNAEVINAVAVGIW